MFGDYATLGVDELFDAAANLIETNGHAIGTPLLPDTNAVDVVGALLVAAGMRPKQILGCDNPEDCLGERQYVRYQAALSMLNGSVDADIATWNDTHEPSVVVDHLRNLSSVLRRSIR